MATPIGWEFIPDNDLGNTVDIESLEAIAYEIDKWLCSTAFKGNGHEQRVAASARENLPTDEMPDERIGFGIFNLRRLLMTQLDSIHKRLML